MIRTLDARQVLGDVDSPIVPVMLLVWAEGAEGWTPGGPVLRKAPEHWIQNTNIYIYTNHAKKHES